MQTHIAHTGDGAGCIVGMQGAKNDMASKGGLHSNLCGFEIADFTHENFIRVLPKNTTKGCSECHAYFVIDGALNQAFNFVFHWVFGGDDFFFDNIEFVERGIEGSGFA